MIEVCSVTQFCIFPPAPSFNHTQNYASAGEKCTWHFSPGHGTFRSMRSLFACTFLALSMLIPVHAAERMKVKIVDHRDSEEGYSYVVPQHIEARSDTNVNCTAYPNSVGCNGTTQTTGTVTPAIQGSYSVRGATFSLLLPDGRIAVVNCASKANLTQWSYAARRSCRMPIVDEIEVEFSKDSAKLIWPVSIDGKKTESETYKIVGILKKP